MPTRSPRSGASSIRGRITARCDHAGPAGDLTARLDREPIAGQIPRELGREGAPEASVGRDRGNEAVGGRVRVEQAAPDAEIGTRRAIDPHLVDDGSRRVHGRAPDDVAFHREGPRAAVRDVDGLESRGRAVIRTDHDDAAERTGGERLGGELEAPRDRVADAAEHQPLSVKRPVVAGDRVQAEPRGRREIRGAVWCRVPCRRTTICRRPGAGPGRPGARPGADRRGRDEPDGPKGDETGSEPAQPS